MDDAIVRVLVFTALAGLAFAPLEQLFGRHRGPRPDRLTDLGFATFGGLLVHLGVATLVGGALALLDRVALAEPLFAGIGSRAARTALEVAVGLVIFELVGYAYHRLAHAVPWLWRLHAVHHSSERMDWLASFRQHPLEIVLMTLAQNAALVLLGLPLGAHALVLLALRLNTVFVHADLELPRSALGVEIRDEAAGNTWLVRPKKAPRGSGPRDAAIIFASAAEGAEGVVAAESLPEYFRAAMASGFVPYWPRCFKSNRYVSYATQEAAVTRFRAKPVAPTPIAAGARVEFEYFSEGGRGEALALHRAPASRHAEFTGREFVRVRLDEGTTAWFPQKWTKALSCRDAYERLREPAELVADDLPSRFDDLARAIGPLAHFSSGAIGTLPSNARRAAGLLATRPFADALRQVLELRDAVVRARLEFKASRPLTQNGDEFGPAELSRFGWRYDLMGVLTGLFGGLQILAHHESARRRVPGRELVPPELSKRLAKIDAAAGLRERLASAEILAAPKWDHVDGHAAELGLPPGEPVLSGTGF